MVRVLYARDADWEPTVGDHIVAFSKGTVDMSIPRYKARGIIFSPDNGVRGELLRRDGESITNVCQDAPSISNGAPCTPGMPYVICCIFIFVSIVERMEKLFPVVVLFQRLVMLFVSSRSMLVRIS